MPANARAREEPCGDLAIPLAGAQTSRVYCITLVQFLYINCYVSLNKLVFSYLLLLLLPQAFTYFTHCTPPKIYSILLLQYSVFSCVNSSADCNFYSYIILSAAFTPFHSFARVTMRSTSGSGPILSRFPTNAKVGS